MQMKRFFGLGIVVFAALIVTGEFSHRDLLADMNSPPSYPSVTECGIVNGYQSFTHFVPQGPLYQMAGESYSLYMASPGASSSSKMTVKYSNGSPELKEIQKYKNMGAALTPFFPGYTDSLNGSTLGPATLIAKDDFGSCKYSFTVTQAPWESNDVPLPIPDGGFIVPEVDVSGLNGPVTHVRVTLWINHTWDSDLVIQLTAPDNTTVMLSDKHGGGGDNYGMNSYYRTIFDDEGTQPIASAQPPYAGTYIPDQALSNFIGHNGNGPWRLQIIDSAVQDVGSLLGFSLTVTDQQ